MRGRDDAGVEPRLAEAAASGETVEVILVVRGRLRRGVRTGRWRIRGAGQGVLSFPPDAVVAITPVRLPARRRRSAS